MPWMETRVMDQRVKFVLECLRGEYSMAKQCRIFGISRKTGYKWLMRYDTEGINSLGDRSRRPKHHGRFVPSDVEAEVVSLRRQHPTWGPKKLRVLLERHGPDRSWPACSTIGEILKRHGLTVPRKRRRRTPPYTQPFAGCNAPNAVWCADFKGWFRTGDGNRCEPLTITDTHSRYLLRCQVSSSTHYETTRALFEATFRQYGLPYVIHTDNGTPFAGRGIAGLSRLSVWWLKLGIVPERIEPGHPEQNGRHERMHRTLKHETANPPAQTLRGQQRIFDRFRREFNQDRPHEALKMQTPSSVYAYSLREYPEHLPDVEYGDDVEVRRVKSNGVFTWNNHRVFIGEAFGRELVGLTQLDEHHWQVLYGPKKLGVLDSREHRMMTASQAAKAPK